MSKPVIMTIDDDAQVLRAIERDLRQKYGGDYRVLRADSGQSALDALAELKLRNDVVALFLVDQKMPNMNGVEFLQKALEIYPQSKRALLTAYADTDAAIAAINSVRIDHYLMKPWDPPEQHLYPILDDLLEDWQAGYRPPFQGVRVIGHRWSRPSHETKDFLARNQIPYQWLDIAGKSNDTQECQLLGLADGDSQKLPLVLFPNGDRLEMPTPTELAQKLGLQTQAQAESYDLAIIGGGPAGLAAAVYGASEGLKTVMIEREAPGGQAGTSSRIENYLGFPSGLTGADLARRAVSQAKRFGVEVLTPQSAREICRRDPYRSILLEDGGEIRCRAALIATGVSYRKLDVPGIENLTGAGVYYGAAATEALNCQDEDVYIVGAANSAGQAAMFFANYAKKVVMLCRSEGLKKSMSSYLIDQIKATANIEVCNHSQVLEAHGDTSLQELTLQKADGAPERVAAAALFIFIGASPRTDWLEGTVLRDEKGFILAGPDVMREEAGIRKPPRDWNLERDPFLLETSVPGVFVAGDVRAGSIKRVASSVGEGSICVQMIHQHLAETGG